MGWIFIGGLIALALFTRAVLKMVFLLARAIVLLDVVMIRALLASLR